MRNITVNELRSVLNTICMDKEKGDYTVCISLQGVTSDLVTFDMDSRNKRIFLKER